MEEKIEGCSCWACNGTGTKLIWINAEEVEDVPCEACGGSGWFSY